MSVSLFPAGEPLRVSIKAAWTGSRNGALIGMFVRNDDLLGIVVGEDGNVLLLQLDDFNVEWRYRAETDRWVDVKELQTDQNY